MGNNKAPKKCRRCGDIAVQGERHCKHCLTHRKCSCCKQELHIFEFTRSIENSAGNLGRCKKCEDIAHNYKKCIGCKQSKYKNEFTKKSRLCLECKKKSKIVFKQKYGYRKCTICKQIKSVDEFDYLLKTCKICANNKKSEICKKNMSIIHCRYCNKVTDNKLRVCDECHKTRKCVVCNIRKTFDEFELEFICKKCFNSAQHVERKKRFYSNRLMPKTSNLQKNVFNELKEKFKTLNVELEYCFDFYKIDIAFPDYKLAIEIDGDYWHGNPDIYSCFNVHQIKRKKHDKIKQQYIENKNWKVLRFWEHDINENIQNCISKVEEFVK